MTDYLLILLVVGFPTLVCFLQDYLHRRAQRRRLYRGPLVRSAVALARRRAGYTLAELLNAIIIISLILGLGTCGVGICARVWGVL